MPLTKSQSAQALEHILKYVFDLDDKDFLRESLQHHGITNIYELIIMKREDVDKLTYVDEDNGVKQRVPIPWGKGQIINVFRDYLIYKDETGEPVDGKWTEIDKDDFDQFRIDPSYLKARILAKDGIPVFRPVDNSPAPITPSLQQQQPPQPQQAGITDLLEEAKGGPLTDSEIDYVLANHSRYIDEILGKTDQRERSRLASRLWLRLCVRIKTQTRLAVRGQYLFNGPVPGAFGRAETEVQFAVRGSSLFCAKTMLETGDLQREHMIATRIHSNQTCPTVMPVLDMIDLPGEPRRITMITPYYPIPLAPLANGNLHEEGCVNVALCGLATIKAFHRKGICHGDIKPENMMLTARSDNVVVTIDFGSAVEYGESLVSVTPQFGLNCPQEGSLKYDLTCLASSLYVICTGEKLPETSKQLLEKLVGGNRMLPPTLQIVMICLQLNDIDSIWESAKVCIEAADGMDHSLIVRHDTVWPKVT